MKVPENGVLLRVFIGQNDKDPERGGALYQSIVRRVHEAHLAGATVLRGAVGYGRHSRIHTVKLLETSEDLPLVIEIVDKAEKIDAFMRVLATMPAIALITVENIRIARPLAAAQG